MFVFHTKGYMYMYARHAYLMGSFHMMSQARSLWPIGLGRLAGTSLMAEMYSLPGDGNGMPPWTQNTWGQTNYLTTVYKL